MARDSQMQERIFFTHSDPHGAALFNRRFLAGKRMCSLCEMLVTNPLTVLSQLSGLENVVFNDSIDDELDSEDVSEQRASASCQILFH